MHISPKRRRRVIQIHYLAQRGLTQRQIAEQLDVSRAVVRADLQLIESHWSTIAAAAADDLLLESLQLLRIRLSIAVMTNAPAKLGEQLSPIDYLRAHEAHEAQLSGLAREIRRTAQAVHQRAAQRPDQPALYDDQDAQTEPKPAQTSPKPTKNGRPEETISSPEQEIVPTEVAEEKIPPEPAHSDELDAMIEEAVTLFPHLKGQSPAQILQFLDELTDPTKETDPIPYPEAAAG